MSASESVERIASSAEIPAPAEEEKEVDDGCRAGEGARCCLRGKPKDRPPRLLVAAPAACEPTFSSGERARGSRRDFGAREEDEG